MPFDDPDATDPMTFHAVQVETDDPNSVQEMAQCFVEEYVRMGVSADQILEIFNDSRFSGPALALRIMGAEQISKFIADEFAIRGERGVPLSIDREPDGTLSLPVMQ